MLDRCTRASRAGHSRVSLVVSLAVVCLLLACGLAFGADATIGLYQDEFGNSCTFNNAPGFITVYVVVKPATGGTRAVEFAAPIPSCFNATYIGESVPFLVVGSGNSQTGISLSARDCQTTPFSVLSILYMTSAGTTPCCPYPIVADPAVGEVQAVDCSFNYQPITTNIARFNADASCPCGLDVQPVPNNPTPVDFAVSQPNNQQLSWQVPGSLQGLTYDVYFGTSNTPPQVAFGQAAQSYDPGLLGLGTMYHWQVVTRLGAASYPGPVWTFTTTGSGPETPNNPNPADGAINVSTNPTLTWGSTGVMFDLYFGTQNPPPRYLINITEHSFSPGILGSNTPYFWRVVAKQPSGVIYVGPAWGFTTQSGGPNPPTSPSPANGASGVSQTPTLSWAASHQQGLPMTFDVYLGTSTPLTKVATNIANEDFHPGFLDVGTYQWYVVARDAQNREASSAIWSFATVGAGNSPPSTPSNPNPPNNSTIAGTNPTFSWSSSDPDTPQLLSFSIALGRSPDVFSTLVGFGSPNVPHYTFGFLPTGRYYWIVAATDGTSIVTGPIWTFDLTLPLAVAFKHFNATASRGEVQVRWELNSDEPMSGFVLYRRDGAALQQRVVAQGALTDATGSYLDTSVDAGNTYRYELLVRTAAGDEFRSAIATVSLPELALALYQNHPNPFNPQTTIDYDLPAAGPVRLVIMDASGRVVRTLVNETQPAGSRSIDWNGRDDSGNAVASGVYFYVLDAGKERLTKKLVLLK